MLEDQIDAQTRRTEEVEKSLREKQVECRRLEEVAAKERRDRAAQELRTGELKTEVIMKSKPNPETLYIVLGGKFEAQVRSARTRAARVPNSDPASPTSDKSWRRVASVSYSCVQPGGCFTHQRSGQTLCWQDRTGVV